MQLDIPIYHSWILIGWKFCGKILKDVYVPRAQMTSIFEG